jgi:hypothetical protein
MSDQPPPRIRVTLPGDTAGRITGWRQDPAGQWWARVEIHAPATAVQQIPGEDYTAVPRQPAPPRYVLATDTHTTPPTSELHQATCWEISQKTGSPRWRITPLLDGLDGPDLLRFDDTTRCTICLPDP